MPDGEDRFFLPDFCGRETVFTVVVAGELLAFVLVLAPGHGGNFLSELAMVSLFIQWQGLSSAGLLCLARGWLQRLGDAAAGIVSFVLLLCVALALSEVAYWLVLKNTASPVHGVFVARNLALSAIVGASVLRYLYIARQRELRAESEAQARIQALQSRIRPHFLFNSMNTIASLTRSDPALAEQITEDLADLFRASLGDASVPSTLAAELELCRGYLNIERQRLGERLRTRFDTRELPDDALLPALSLQPLIENAVYHGIESRPEGGCIRLEGTRDGEHLLIRLTNRCAQQTSTRPGHQMAQRNVGERLRAYFGPEASLETEQRADEYLVRVRIPYQRNLI